MLPATIEQLTGNLPYQVDSVGLSGSQVRCYQHMVLKIQPLSEEARNEAAMMRWLEGKLPAPKLLAEETDGKLHYLLMSRLTGRMLCDPALLNQPDQLLSLACDGLKQLWQLNPADCPADRTLTQRLRLARQRVEAGLCSTENVQPDTYGPGGFASPLALLEWLEKNRPDEELYVTHGDCCLPNLFADASGFGGFIDWGRGGSGDRWQDIALLYRSMTHNYDGSHGFIPQAACPAEQLFDRLGVTPDPEKLRYYILLDELF